MIALLYRGLNIFSAQQMSYHRLPTLENICFRSKRYRRFKKTYNVFKLANVFSESYFRIANQLPILAYLTGQFNNHLAIRNNQHYRFTLLFNFIQGLLNARKKEIETEEHLHKIAEREEGRLGQEIKRLQHELDDLKEKKNMYENNIFKQTQRLEDLKSQMNWDQQALEAWLEESARKDEDSMIMAKYTRQDEAKVKVRMIHLNYM